MRNVLLLLAISVCASHANALNIVSFDLDRGNDLSLAQSPYLNELRAAIREFDPDVRMISTPTLTPGSLIGADVVFLSSVRGGHDAANPLSPTEQSALYQFVLSGGLAILITDNSTFEPSTAPAANASLVQMFGLSCTGTGPGSDLMTFTTTNWASNGPFGDVTDLYYSFPGGYSSLGAYAQNVGTVSGLSLCGSAIIERNALQAGSGAVFFTSDCTWVLDGLITGGKIVIKNVLATLPTLSGHVSLQNLDPDPDGRIIEISVRPAGGPEIALHHASLDESGNYSVPINLPTGHYDFGIKSSHWLRQTAGNVHFVGTGTQVNASLINGDVDGDNEVTLVDVGQLAAAFGSAEGDGNWNPEADLDGDGEVTIVDYGTLAANFGLSGDE